MKKIICSLLVLFPMLVSAQPCQQLGGGVMLNRLAKQLDLSEDQVAAIKDLDFKNSKSEFWNAMREERTKLHNLVLSDTATKVEIAAQMEIMDRIHAEHRNQMVDNLLQLKSILTPDQLGQFMELKDEGSLGFGQGNGRGGMKQGRGAGMGKKKGGGQGRNRQ